MFILFANICIFVENYLDYEWLVCFSSSLYFNAWRRDWLNSALLNFAVHGNYTGRISSSGI